MRSHLKVIRARADVIPLALPLCLPSHVRQSKGSSLMNDVRRHRAPRDRPRDTATAVRRFGRSGRGPDVLYLLRQVPHQDLVPVRVDRDDLHVDDFVPLDLARVEVVAEFLAHRRAVQ